MQRIADRLWQAGAAALALALVPAPLLAQSVSDWRLPGATVRPAPPGAQGPVDGENPVVTTTAPRPAQSAPPTPSASATPSPVASTAPTPAAAPRRTIAPVRQTAPAAMPAMPATAAPRSDTPASDAAVPATMSLPAPASAAANSWPGWYWPWIAGAAGLLVLIFAGLWWRRRGEKAVPAAPFERPVVQARAVQARKAAPRPAEPAAPVPPPVAPPEPAAPASALGVALEARRMNASLMATSLNYVLKLTNHGAEPLSALAIEGDMISAHASLPQDAQIANDNQRMEPRHNLIALAPGESAEFSGVFMLPLTAVTPIRAGDAAYFVPLARLRVQASTPSGGALVQAQTWVVGELPEDAASALKPFRLDLGPRTYSRVGQRAVN